MMLGVTLRNIQVPGIILAQSVTRKPFPYVMLCTNYLFILILRVRPCNTLQGFIYIVVIQMSRLCTNIYVLGISKTSVVTIHTV